MTNYSSSIASASAGTIQLFTAAILASIANHAIADDNNLYAPGALASYTTSAISPSSPSNESLSFSEPARADSQLTEASIMVYRKMLAQQQPLEAEFAKVLEDNFWDLCGA